MGRVRERKALGRDTEMTEIPSPAARTVTLTDVARLAGVSISTASKALNGRAQVNAQTRKRVLRAADQRHFQPNPPAPGLLAGRSGTVAPPTSAPEGRVPLP